MRNSNSENKIGQVREETLKYFKREHEIPNSFQVVFSPDYIYKIELRSFNQIKPNTNWDVTEVNLLLNQNSQPIFTFFVNTGGFFHSWLKKNNQDFLICAEDLCGGQTVINLTEKKMVSFSKDDDGFIWINHFLSPNQNSLAVVGCVWGSPNFITVYDFTSPMTLPLPVIYESDYSIYDVVEWVDDTKLKVKLSQDKVTIISIMNSA